MSLCSLITGRCFWGASQPRLPGSYGSDWARVVITVRAGCPVHLVCRDPSVMPLDSIRGWLCGCGARGPQGSPLPSAECQAISLESPSSQSWRSMSSGNMPRVSRGCGFQESGAHPAQPPECPPGPLLSCCPRGSLPGPGGLSRFEDSCAVCWAHARFLLSPPVPLLSDLSDQHTGWNSSHTEKPVRGPGGFAQFNNVIP